MPYTYPVKLAIIRNEKKKKEIEEQIREYTNKIAKLGRNIETTKIIIKDFKKRRNALSKLLEEM